MSQDYRYPDNYKPQRGPWYLLTGFILGLFLGLIYAWVISPVSYIDTPPASLRPDFKDQYRTMIALAYSADKDLSRARARLALLGDKDSIQSLTAQAQHAVAEGQPQSEAQALGLLAASLTSAQANPQEGQAPTQIPAMVQTPGSAPSVQASNSPSVVTTANPSSNTLSPANAASPTQAFTPPADVTFTPLPSRTPTATPGTPFVLQSRQFVCDPNLKKPLLQILVFNTSGLPVSGVQALVAWSKSQDNFFTGLKPELGLGYADFIMSPEVNYTLRLGDGGQPINDLTPAECQTSRGERYWGSWLLTFNQP